MTPNDIALLQPRDGANEDAAVAHDKILAFHQEKAKVTREVGLFEVGQAQGAWGEDADSWLGSAPGRLQARAQRSKKRSEALNVKLSVKIRKSLRDDQPVFQG